ncbi:MAG: aminotransferase class III-fold pyridoxal phosphate-dependent enzyme [Rhodobacteraceae bacterium]|jgi:adenosylmethionine-8-amino-7-oxononanoate aminotransferase|nr:aminotransferase class III-fold pyridoxal phosphate-dependent enzyme [Paracoccaceae bacterium]
MTSTSPQAGAPHASRSNRRGEALLHFTPLRNQMQAPTIVRGEGCHVFDESGRKYFDGLATLFCVQIGYSHGAEIAEAAAEQLKTLPFFSNWGFRHSASEALAQRVCDLAPEGFNRAFFVSGGSDANEAAWKLAMQYFQLKGERRYKAITRQNAYHGTTLGALSLTAISSIRAPFEPLIPGGGLNISNTSRLRRPKGESDADFLNFLLAEVERTIECAGPETVAILFLEPVQTSAGVLVAPPGYYEGIRAICDKYGILICSDEVIAAFGRFGEWFAAAKYGLRPDIITCAKGLTSAYGVMGATLVADHVLEPFTAANAPFAHGITFGGHPVQAAIALRNLDIMERIDVLGNVRRNTGAAGQTLRWLEDLPNVGEVRGDGYLWGVELVEDKATLRTLGPEARARVGAKLLPLCLEHGLIVRVDTRAVPSILISPPLIAGIADFEFIEQALRQALIETFAD